MDFNCPTVPFHYFAMEAPPVPGVDLAQVTCAVIGQHAGTIRREEINLSRKICSWAHSDDEEETYNAARERQRAQGARRVGQIVRVCLT